MGSDGMLHLHYEYNICLLSSQNGIHWNVLMIRYNISKSSYQLAFMKMVYYSETCL